MKSLYYILSILTAFTSVSTIAADKTKTSEFEYALKSDSAKYAQLTKIDPEKAYRRFLTEDYSAKIVEELRAKYKDRLAGIYIEHEPYSKIVVKLVGNSKERNKALTIPQPQFSKLKQSNIPLELKVEFEENAQYTNQQLNDLLDNHINEIKQIYPNLQGSYVDEKTGEIVLTILKSNDDLTKLNQVKSLLNIPIRLMYIGAPLSREAVRGSGTIINSTTGEGCTTGFVVKQTSGSTTGVATAGHCGQNNTTASYTGVDGASHTLTPQSSSLTSTTDVKWYTTNGTNEAKFYAESSTTPRTLTGRRSQASTAVGQNYCHYGITTGFSCGDVTSVAYKPVQSNGDPLCGPNNNIQCSNTWIALVPPSSSPGLACAGGDSGGPWFISTVAVGIHSMGASRGNSIGQCDLAIYMSTDRLNAINVQLLY
ncbi:S1 family peptidase [Acinetobacter sp. NIPH1876]|uniref:S1 family peptidase n=1 Tax=unclassified Acinetobacter TaxID=196816 RepID=UPI001FABDBFC|nr:S1 family peptidase [Acinetobacter sp. NIPH1876]MCJ0829148.1 S1 family peptidase [Acinetobacter sp. NIPH1876]